MSGVSRAFIAACVAASVFSVPAFANHSWDGLHWARPNGAEVKVPVGDNVGSQWDKYVSQAVNNWNKSTVIQSPIVPGKTPREKCNLIAGTIQICNSTYGVTGWLGLTSVLVSNGHISAMSSKLNDSYFNTPTFNTAGWRLYVTCHELGHAYGLWHQDEDMYNSNIGTCLDIPLYVAGNESPNPHDYEMLLNIYNHGDSSIAAPLGSTSTADLQIGNNPRDWGRAVRFDRLGRPTTFIRILAPTKRMLTEVLWAPAVGPGK